MLEIIFVVVLLLSSITLIFIERGLTKKNIVILLINYAFLFATIIVIGANWRMIPAYFLLFVLTLQVFLKPKTTAVSKKLVMKVLKRFRNYRNCYRNVYITFTFSDHNTP